MLMDSIWHKFMLNLHLAYVVFSQSRLGCVMVLYDFYITELFHRLK